MLRFATCAKESFRAPPCSCRERAKKRQPLQAPRRVRTRCPKGRFDDVTAAGNNSGIHAALMFNANARHCRRTFPPRSRGGSTMLKITKQSSDRVDIELSGKLDADTMRSALDELIAKTEDVRHGRMLYRITDFSFPTLGAIGVEMTRIPKLFGLLGKFDKCAVLSDAGWLRKAAEIEGALFPGIAIKSFELHEASAAEAWLSS